MDFDHWYHFIMISHNDRIQFFNAYYTNYKLTNFNELKLIHIETDKAWHY